MITRLIAALAALAAASGIVWYVAVKDPLPLFSAHIPPAAAPVMPSVAKAQPQRSVGIVTYNIEIFDQACGCRPDLAVRYVQMSNPPDLTSAKTMIRNGAVPMLEIEPFTQPLDGIIAGDDDTWLTAYAKDVRRLHAPVLLSFAPEPNGGWYPWGDREVSAGTYIRAWRHVVRVFRGAGAGNARWVWVVNRSYPGSAKLSSLWPGRAYVDMLGIDGYYERPTSSFGEVFSSTIRQLRAFTSRPILISETAAASAAGQLRALRQILAAEARFHLAGFVWFDIRQNAGIHHQDWRIETHPAALAAYRSAVEHGRRGP